MGTTSWRTEVRGDAWSYTGALGLAAELWGLTGYLRWRLDGQKRHLVALALGGLVLGLSYPFGLPVLLAVTTVDALSGYVGAVRPGANLPKGDPGWQGMGTSVPGSTVRKRLQPPHPLVGNPRMRQVNRPKPRQ